MLKIIKFNSFSLYSKVENGKKMREQLGLDTEDLYLNQVEVHLAGFMTSSFLRGLFGNSILSLGKKRFLNKYKFVGKLELIDYVIKRIG